MDRETESSGIRIRRGSGLPLYQQLVDQLRYLIAAGRYRVGDYLPTMRTLAGELDLNFNTVNRAYRQLQRDGLIESTPGKGAVVVRAEPESVRGLTPRAGRGVPEAETVDSIVAAALERALAAGWARATITRRVEDLLDGFSERIPPPPAVAVFGGRVWRSRALAERLDRQVPMPVTALDDEPAPDLLVLPRFGAWTPDPGTGLSAVPRLELPVLPDRPGVAALLAVEEPASLCAVAADEGVARWLLDTAVAFARPRASRWQVVESAAAVAAADAEWVVCESGLPDLDSLASRLGDRLIPIETAFPATAAELISEELRTRAASRPQR